MRIVRLKWVLLYLKYRRYIVPALVVPSARLPTLAEPAAFAKTPKPALFETTTPPDVWCAGVTSIRPLLTMVGPV